MAKLLTCPQCGAKRGAKTLPYHLTVCRGRGSERAGKPTLVTRDDLARTP